MGFTLGQGVPSHRLRGPPGGEQRPGGVGGEPDELGRRLDRGDHRHRGAEHDGVTALFAAHVPGAAQDLGPRRPLVGARSGAQQKRPRPRAPRRFGRGQGIGEMLGAEFDGAVELVHLTRRYGADGEGALRRVEPEVEIGVGAQRDRAQHVGPAGGNDVVGQASVGGAHHGEIERPRIGQALDHGMLVAGQRVDQGVERRSDFAVALAQDIGDHRRPRVIARQREAERVGLLPVAAAILAHEAAHLAAGARVVVLIEQAVDLDPGVVLAGGLGRGEAQQLDRRLDVGQRQQPFDAQCQQAAASRLAPGRVPGRRRARQQQLEGELAGEPRRSRGGEPRQQPLDQRLVGSLPQIDPEAALRRIEEPDRIGIDGGQRIDLDLAGAPETGPRLRLGQGIGCRQCLGRGSVRGCCRSWFRGGSLDQL